VLVIFIIRTHGSPLASRPNVWLVGLSLAVVALAALLPWLPFAGELGFVPPPPVFYAVLAGIVAAYLTVMLWAKQVFYRRWERRSGRPR
jgi:Mg2+-importing ATPase